MGRPKGSKNLIIRHNKIIEDGDKIRIVLESKKHGTKECIIDKDCYEKVNFTRWQILKRGHLFHVQSCSDHNIYIHRILLPDAEIVDHINGDGLDNRMCNLRKATKTTNAQNRRVTPGTYKGVMLDRFTGKYKVRIKLNKKEIIVGYFLTPIEAASAYNEAALKYFGEFARLNIIDDDKLSESEESSGIELL